MAIAPKLGPQVQLCCPPCNTRPTRYYIDLYIKGTGQVKLYSDRTGNIFEGWEQVERSMVGIRYEIDQGIFDPTKYVKADKKAYLFETQIENWYQAKLDEVKLGNLASSYTRHLRRYKDEFYPRHFKGKDVREIRTYDIDDFYRKLPKYFKDSQDERKAAAEKLGNKIVEKESWSIKYIQNVMSALESFFVSLYELERIGRVPIFPTITVHRKAPKWTARASQIEILSEIAEEDRDIFNFLSFQGIRPGESRALKVKDFDLDDESFTTARTVSDRKIVDRTKSKVQRPRALNPILVPMLRRLCEGKHPEAFVFINPRTKRPYTEDAMFDIWDKARKAKGLDLNIYQATRHSFASNLLKDGVDISVISKLLGHTDIRTTMIYTHADLATQKVAFKKQTENNVVPLQPRTSPSPKTADEK